LIAKSEGHAIDVLHAEETMRFRFLLLALFVFTASSAWLRRSRFVPATSLTREGHRRQGSNYSCQEREIVEVAANVEIPRDAEIVDLSNFWVMPD